MTALYLAAAEQRIYGERRDVGPIFEPVHVPSPHAEHFGDDGDRQRVRERCYQVEALAPGDRIEQP